MSLRLLDSFVSTEQLAVVFCDRAFLANMLRFEVALARAEARAGVVPMQFANTIADAATPEAFDASAIVSDSWTSATLAVPFVDALRGRVASIDPEASTYVHWGATSQDVSDTALVLCATRAAAILETDHARLQQALRQLSERHASAIMLARTVLQPAAPITFGAKAAAWFAAVSRTGTRMFAQFDEAAVLQFGGACGTLAALGERGPAVSAELARELGLDEPEAPWHAHRDRLASLVCACGVYSGTLAKIARDISLLMQDEVGEAFEPGGPSSAMPHKRNPSGCAITLAAASRVPGLVATFLAGMAQEHERGVGGWLAEASTLATAVQATGAALAAVTSVVAGLTVDVARMRENLAITREVVFAERAMMLLAPALGRDAAARLIDAAINVARHENRAFGEILALQTGVAAVLTRDELAQLVSPEAYITAAEYFRRRQLSA